MLTLPRVEDQKLDPASEPADLRAVERALHLARLGASAQGGAAFAAEFARILASFSELRAIDVIGVEPMHTPSSRVDALREDLALPSLERAQLLANAPDPRDGFFGVPKTLGGDS